MAESKRLKAIAVSIELWTDITTQGWTVGSHTVIKCTSGLPANAKFVSGTYSDDMRAVILTFEHESFPELAFNEPPPFIDVTYQEMKGAPICPECNERMIPFTSDVGPFRKGWSCGCWRFKELDDA